MLRIGACPPPGLGDGRIRESNYEAIVTFQVIDDDAWNQHGSQGGAEKQLNSEYILKGEPAG